ncbi:BlaI/MecI/CopY family transcriptional regulator [Candidatus Latescibacterota bacterium]
MKKLEIGKGQMKVLRVLWEGKRVTAQEVTDILNKSEPIKFSTVSTFLRSLVRKGAAAYDVDNRTYIYYPLVKEEEVAEYALNDMIDHVFAGSVDGFVSFIIKNKYFPPDELEKIRKLVEKEEK